MANRRDSIQTLELRATLDNEILALLSQGARNRLWREREIIDGLGHPVSICALERLQAAGKVRLTLDDNLTYLCRVEWEENHPMEKLL